MAHIAVIGAGISGLVTARHLHGLGFRVTLIERGPVGREASWAGGGILSPLHPWRYAPALLHLARWSQDLFPALAAELAGETGIDPEWTRSGLLVLDTQDQAEAIRWGERWRMPVRQLRGEALKSCEPLLGPDYGAALYLPEIAQIRNPRLLKALRRSLELRGVAVREQAPVTGFSARGGRLEALQLAGQRLPVDAAVVTAGAWSAGLLAPTGLELPITPVRGQMLVLRGAPGQLQRMVLEDARYLIPRRDGLILVGSTIEQAGFDKSTSDEARQDLLAAARRMAPALSPLPVVYHWAGLRPGSPGGVPYIGRHPEVGNLYLNAGHFRNGLMLAPACATLLGELLQERPTTVDPAPYDPGRVDPAAPPPL